MPGRAVAAVRDFVVVVWTIMEVATVFRSKVDIWLVIVLASSAAIAAWAAVWSALQVSGAGLIVPVFIAAVGVVLPLWILAWTRYSIADGVLRIRSGPFFWRIPIDSITGMTPSRSPLSSPALSLQRLRVDYGAGKAIMISPDDLPVFMRAIERARKAS